ncbi:hypothetical protein ACWDUN_11150 [Mycobacterium sp. NPDC003323]
MTIKFAVTVAAPILTFAASVLGAGVAPVSAQPYGPDTCTSGFVWREARPGDRVCVTPAERDAVAQQNANFGANRDPNAGYGPLGCAQGFVWREAFDGDAFCVPPGFRQQMFGANAAANSRKAANQAPVPPPPPPPLNAGPSEPGHFGSGPIEDILERDPCSMDGSLAPPGGYNKDLCFLPYE